MLKIVGYSNIFSMYFDSGVAVNPMYIRNRLCIILNFYLTHVYIIYVYKK